MIFVTWHITDSGDAEICKSPNTCPISQNKHFEYREDASPVDAKLYYVYSVQEGNGIWDIPPQDNGWLPDFDWGSKETYGGNQGIKGMGDL